MSANEKFPVYNHYYTRGYPLNRAADGNHTVPIEGKVMDGFGSVGCSRTLALPVLEKIEMGKIFNCDTSSSTPITSMFFYPFFSIERGRRFGIVGQTVTHPEGNFVNFRPNFFTHNYVFTPAGLKNYIEKCGLENIVSMSFREKYVDESNATGAANELKYQCSVDEPFDSMLEIPHNAVVSDDTGLTMDRAKALVLALTKPRARVVVRVSDENAAVDSKARSILKTLYRWLPVKIASNLGFITCLNGSTAHESCNLVFCNTADYQRIKKDGLSGNSNSVIMYVDLVDPSTNLLPENIDINIDERDYIDWMAAALSGSADPLDHQPVQSVLREQENKLIQHKIDYNFVLLSRIFRCVNKLNMGKRATTEDLSMLLIHCFSMIYSASTISDECVAELMPLFKESITFVKSNPEAFRSKNCDKIIIATENKKPAVLDSVVSELLVNGQTDTVEWISTVRILNKDLNGLYELVVTGLLPTINPSTVAEIAADKYEKCEYSRDEAPIGRKIAYTLVNKYPNNRELLDCCNRLWNSSVSACARSGIRVFGGITSVDALVGELNFLSLISNHSRKSINANCRRMIKEISETNRESELEAVNRLVRNIDMLPSNFNNSDAVPEILNCILALCQKSGSCQYHAAAKFCNISKNHIDFARMNKQALATISEEFTKAIALHGDGRNLLDYAALIIENDQNRLYSFVESIAPALTVQMIATPGSLPGDSQRKSAISALNQRRRRVISFSIYNQFFAGITPPTVGYGKTVADTLESVPLRDINNIPISPAVFSGYNLDQNDGAKSIRRQRRARLEIAEQKLRLTDKRNANFTAFLNELPIDPPIRYKNNILDDMCSALEGGEDVRKTIALLTDKFEKIDVSKPMCFTNSNLARGSRLFSLYLANAKASSHTKSEEDMRMLIATSDSLRKMFDRNTTQITDTLKPAAERFRSYYFSVANCILYGVEEYTSTQLFKLNSIPISTNESIRDVAISAISSIAAAYNSILNSAASGVGNQISSTFRCKTEAVNNHLDHLLLSSLSANDCTMLVNLLNGRQLDLFGMFFPLSCERLTKDAVKLCQADPTSKQLVPLVREIKKQNNANQLQNSQSKSDLGYIYNEYTSRKDAASTSKTISMALLSIIVVLGLTLALINILRPKKPELEPTCVVSNGTLYIDDEWIVCADRENILSMELTLSDGKSIAEEKQNLAQNEHPALMYRYSRPAPDPMLSATPAGYEKAAPPADFAFIGPIPNNNFTYCYNLITHYEVIGYSAEGENSIISLEEDLAALYLRQLDSLRLRYVDELIGVEVEIHDIRRPEPEVLPSASDIVETTGSDVVTTGSDIPVEEHPAELDVDLSGLTLEYSIDEDETGMRGNILYLKQKGHPNSTYDLDDGMSYSYTIRLTFSTIIPAANNDDRLTIVYGNTPETITTPEKEFGHITTSSTPNNTTPSTLADVPISPSEAQVTEAPSEILSQPKETESVEDTEQSDDFLPPDVIAETPPANTDSAESAGAPLS